jgi:hypothetical protein
VLDVACVGLDGVSSNCESARRCRHRQVSTNDRGR